MLQSGKKSLGLRAVVEERRYARLNKYRCAPRQYFNNTTLAGSASGCPETGGSDGGGSPRTPLQNQPGLSTRSLTQPERRIFLSREVDSVEGTKIDLAGKHVC